MHTHTRHDQWVTFETEKKTCLETRTINCLDNCFVYFATHWFVERCLSLLCLSPELNKVFKGGSWLFVHSISMGSLVFQNFLHPKIPFFAIQFFSVFSCSVSRYEFYLNFISDTQRKQTRRFSDFVQRKVRNDFVKGMQNNENEI